jgi:hypothetical protein
MTVTPISLREACAFVAKHHRHSKPPRGHLFAVAVSVDDFVHGVAIVGRPVAAGLQDGWTCEVLRLATDGEPNACSKLYRAAWRAARAMGYRRLVTYTLATEPGTSCRAAGLRLVGTVVPARNRTNAWASKGRPRIDTEPHQAKFRWELAA